MTTQVTIEEVREAITSIEANGSKATVRAIHAAIGRGSLTTLLKLKREVETGTPETTEDTPEMIARFRQIWDAAVEAGRAQRDAEILALREEIEALATEHDTINGLLTAAQARQTTAETQRDDLMHELTEAHRQLTAARAAGEQHASRAAEALGKLADMSAAHINSQTQTHENLRNAQNEKHSLEIQLARTEQDRNSLREYITRLEETHERTQTTLTHQKEELSQIRETLARTETERDTLRKQLETAKPNPRKENKRPAKH